MGYHTVNCWLCNASFVPERKNQILCRECLKEDPEDTLASNIIKKIEKKDIKKKPKKKSKSKK